MQMQQEVAIEQIRALADEIARLAHAQLSREPPASRPAYEDMIRHVKGIQRAVDRLTDN